MALGFHLDLLEIWMGLSTQIKFGEGGFCCVLWM